MPRVRYAEASIRRKSPAPRHRPFASGRISLIIVRLQAPRGHFTPVADASLLYRRRQPIRGRGTGAAGLQSQRPSFCKYGRTLFFLCSGDPVVLAKRIVVPMEQAPISAACPGAAVRTTLRRKSPMSKAERTCAGTRPLRPPKRARIAPAAHRGGCRRSVRRWRRANFLRVVPHLYAVQDRVVAPDGVAAPRPALGPGEGRFDPGRSAVCLLDRAPDALNLYLSSKCEGLGRIAARLLRDGQRCCESVEEVQRLALERYQKSRSESASAALPEALLCLCRGGHRRIGKTSHRANPARALVLLDPSVKYVTSFSTNPPVPLGRARL